VRSCRGKIGGRQNGRKLRSVESGLPGTAVHCTVVAATKPVPLMAAEADAEPAANADGEIWVIAGMGLLICRLIEPVEMLVPPLLATIDAVPAVASWLVGMQR
jgi:hypothetical protein